MGLDLALGAIVLIGAIRGYFRGFVLQAVGLGALAGCVFLADPVRDGVRPYTRELFPAIAPDVLDRLTWWACTVACYVLITGTAGWVIRLRRRRPTPFGEPDEANRADQGAGFLLGAAKGAIIASFIAAGIARYIPGRIPPGGAIEAQTQKSQAMQWVETYHPAERIWNSLPVQAYITQVKRRGMWLPESGPITPEGRNAGLVKDGGPSSSNRTAPAEVPSPTRSGGSAAIGDEGVQTAHRTPTLEVPQERKLDPSSPTFLEEAARELKSLGLPGTDSIQP